MKDRKMDIVQVAILLVINLCCIIYLLNGYCSLRDDMDKQLTEKDIYISQLEQDVANRDAKILSLENRAYQYDLEIEELNNNIETLVDNRDILQEKCTKLEKKLHKAEIEISDVNDLYGDYLSEAEKFLIQYQQEGGEVEDIGQWKCTAYCCEKRAHICGTGTGITASGEPVQADVSVSINKGNLGKLPFGTKIYIEGVGVRTIQDTGGGVTINQFDCAVDTHSHALSWEGFGTHRAWILKEAEK